jgi:hypothetical protein
VLNARDGSQESNLACWLEMVEARAAGAPVIVVLNKAREPAIRLNERAVMARFPNVRAFAQTDCETEAGLAELRDLIEGEAQRLEHLRLPFPIPWFTIKERLAHLGENYIPYEKYRDLCAQNGEPDSTAQDSLADTLHHLGQMISFRDETRLLDKALLNPQWVAEFVIRLLGSNLLEAERGDLSVRKLSDIFEPAEYPREAHDFLIALLQRFGLCFEIEGKPGYYFFPSALPETEPEWQSSFPSPGCLEFEYHYSSLPASLLPRFIARIHERMGQLPRWKNGAIVEFEGYQALVRADSGSNSLFVRINGPPSGRRRLLAIVREQLDRVHRSFPQITIQEKVPVPGRTHLRLDYRTLLVLEANHRATWDVVDGNEVVPVDLKLLLEGTPAKQCPGNSSAGSH